MDYRDRWLKKAMATPIPKPSEKELKEVFGEKEYRRIKAIMNENQKK